MSPVAVAVAAVVASYLCGSVPWGVVIGKLRGVDVRKVGSGNIGATNAARALGRKLGALVLLLDALKGWLPVELAKSLFHGDARAPWLVAAVALAAFLGHLFPPWLRFRGGKGVATGLGVFLALAPMSAGIALAVWIGIYVATRISSVGSLVATTVIVPTMALRHEPRAYVVLSAVLYVLIVAKHHDNIRRLLRRQEGKV